MTLEHCRRVINPSGNYRIMIHFPVDMFDHEYQKWIIAADAAVWARLQHVYSTFLDKQLATKWVPLMSHFENDSKEDDRPIINGYSQLFDKNMNQDKFFR